MTKENPIERLESIVPYAPDHPFPLENLPWTVFSTPANSAPRCAVRLADQLVDLVVLSSKASTAFSQSPLSAEQARTLFAQPTLNTYLAQPRRVHQAFRAFLQQIFSADSTVFASDSQLLQGVLVPVEQAKLHLPIRAGDYTDFCASQYHCTSTGRLMFNDPTRPLEDQWFQLPIAYHGRSSSLVVSGTNFARPQGIFRTKPGSSEVEFGPSKRMDFELEVAFVVGGSASSDTEDVNALGKPVPLREAEEVIFGMMLMNDWSARDIQGYEMNPLGPFTGKNFATTLLPYLVELAALEPFRTPSPPVEHTPFAYLDHKGTGSTWDINLQAHLAPLPTTGDKVWTKITDTSLKHVYWTAAQMVAHHTVTGCNLRAADTFATGTVSGPFDEEHSEASLIEACKAGRKPIPLVAAKGAEAQTRTFLEDGDEVRITGSAYDAQSKLHIGFGECTGQLLPAIPL
ncbi:related to fumarylacetoacetate hydrolase [Sporisorium reilianum SRZ2]|uniref:Fumarylacetoacetase n=1 Tax=Sporisorium reilianum (strain SRZ2) TaxID=999809 RepID=E7A3C9_SPORE|nr:related to fumarylacetoacetate hydrolase [Sporisorium reilianum SRZ2]